MIVTLSIATSSSGDGATLLPGGQSLSFVGVASDEVAVSDSLIVSAGAMDTSFEEFGECFESLVRSTQSSCMHNEVYVTYEV